jgi:AcrR family transcriptional regulator
MEGKKIDRRIQRTRQLLLDALVALILENGYDSITVQDIIDRANVGRSTFYAHFQDKEDLLLSGFEILREQFEKHLTGNEIIGEDPWVLSLVMFQHAQSIQKLYKALVGKQSGNMLMSYIHKYLVVLIRSHLKSQMPNKAKQQIPPEIMAQYFASSLIGLLVWWLDNDLPYTAENMNDMYRHLTKPGVFNILQSL